MYRRDTIVILGINGGLDLQHTNKFNWLDNTVNHDSAAALICDGKILSCIEEERLNRIKHTNKFPYHAIRFVLDENNISLSNIDFFAIYGNERYMDQFLKKNFARIGAKTNCISIRSYIQNLFVQQFGYKVNQDKIEFVDHHLAHASSSYFTSGYSDSLVITLDGTGDGYAGMVFHGYKNKLEILEKIPDEQSLGIYYQKVIHYLGFGPFDEYKAMGLAPYGNPARFRKLFQSFFKCLPGGQFKIQFEYIHFLKKHLQEQEPLYSYTEFNQTQMDIAASLQESIETIIMHILSFYQMKGEYDTLCLAGGVAHNCSVNGKILYSNLFRNVFVQPASHDAGCSLGAAMYCNSIHSTDFSPQKLENVYYGGDVGADNMVEEILDQWESMITWEHIEQIEQKTASLLASGKCIGWVQGKSEFGPRSLGNRSILADPRPAENKAKINTIVKKRETFRPFAPSILLEYAKEYYEFPGDVSESSYMTFVYKTKEQKKDTLGAVTHVDGTARIQTVDSAVNKRYWTLINEFKKITGIPILLNTSFNNNMEPIVETPSDALVCFLTTQLDFLVIGNYLIQKRPYDKYKLLSFIPKLPGHIILEYKRQYISQDDLQDEYYITFNYTQKYRKDISAWLFKLLTQINNETCLNDLLQTVDLPATVKHMDAIFELWSLRYIELNPSKNKIGNDSQ